MKFLDTYLSVWQGISMNEKATRVSRKQRDRGQWASGPVGYEGENRMLESCILTRLICFSANWPAFMSSFLSRSRSLVSVSIIFLSFSCCFLFVSISARKCSTRLHTMCLNSGVLPHRARTAPIYCAHPYNRITAGSSNIRVCPRKHSNPEKYTR